MDDGQLSSASKPSVSAIVVCYNEEDNIGRCLNSLRWCDEIVVVDSFSTDRTVEICRQFTNIIIEGEWAGRVTGLHGQRVESAMMRTPDGHGRLELSRFDAPATVSDHRTAPVNSLGYLRVMFAVEDIDDTLARLSKLGATLVDDVVNYEDVYRLCYIRGPEGILIGLAQELGQQTSR